MARLGVLMWLLSTAPMLAQEAKPPPSEDLKVHLLKDAYHLNGDSMVRWGCIDMSHPASGYVPCPLPGHDDPKPEPPKAAK